MINWSKTIFLHTGWTKSYDGIESPQGAHKYINLPGKVGVEASNFVNQSGWCYGYAPVGRTSEGRSLQNIPKASRTLRIEKLGASLGDRTISGITVLWTATRPKFGPVVVGTYENAVVIRNMPGLSEGIRPFIAKAQVTDCHMVPASLRDFSVKTRLKGFPGMAAAWFVGLHKDGPAQEMLSALSEYIHSIRIYTNEGNRV